MLLQMPEAVIKALMQYSYDQSNLQPITGNPDITNVQKFQADGGYGKGYHSGNQLLNTEFYVPGNQDVSESDASFLQFCVESTPQFSNEVQDQSQCIVSENTSAGRTVDAGTSISVQIAQGQSVTGTVTTEQDQSFTAGVTVGVKYGFSEVSDVHADVSFSYTYTTGKGVQSSTGTSTTNTQTLTILPQAGQQCQLVVTDESCPGSVTVTIPIKFKGSIVVHYFGGEGTQHYYDRPDMQTVMETYQSQFQSASASALIQQISTNYQTIGSFNESCTCVDQTKCGPGVGGNTNSSTNGASGNQASSYQPNLSCPANFATIANSCHYTLADYTSGDLIKGDKASWTSNGVNLTQSPPAGTQLNYGTTQIVLTATASNGATASCQGLVQVVPPWAVDFKADDVELIYPSSGAQTLDTSYVAGYDGLCDDNQAGQCHVTGITSQNMPGMTYKALSGRSSPSQTFEYSSNGVDWPFGDELTFALQCSDPYGNQGGAFVYQHAYRDEVVVTAPGATTTSNFHTETDYVSTSIVTFHTAIVTPEATITQHTQTLYTATDYTSTRSITAAGASVATQVVATTVPMTKNVTQTTELPASTVTSIIVQTQSQQPAKHATSLVTQYTSTKTITPTISRCSTVTRTARPTRCRRAEDVDTDGELRRDVGDGWERRARPTGTTTTSDPQITTTVTDSTDTLHTTVSGVSTSTDLTDVFTRTGSVTRTIYDISDTVYASAASTGILTDVIEAYTTTLTQTSVSTATDTVTVTSTQAPKFTTITSHVGGTGTSVQSVTSTTTYHGVTTVTAKPITKYTSSTTTYVLPHCTR